FIIGRLLYLRGYVADPKTRGIGFILSLLPSLILVIGGLIGAAMNLM
ncbi:MAG: MAPEG family protein, partial [Kordiimonadaceae bacterium]|nr:MAPEG family protein [Kordiimonadaceae bacterium]